MNLSNYKPIMSTLHMPYLKYVMVLALLLCTLTTSAQFSVNVIASTPETCPGNGTITLGTNNASPGATITYQVYLPPGTSALWNSANPNVTGLTDGTYQVTATQVVNGNTTVSAPQEVTIADNTSTVAYNLTANPATCGPDGTITVNITSGTAVSYEIISGPVTRAPQPDNIFEDLPSGAYTVRVNDPCGFGVPQTISVGINGPVLEIGGTLLPDVMLPSCNTITLQHDINENTNAVINYPINVTVTIYPPDGSPAIVYTTTATPGASSPPEKATFSIEVPLYYGQEVDYHVVIDDGCTIYESDHTMMGQLTLDAVFDDAGCDGKLITLGVTKYFGSFTVEFDEASLPPGFDPADFNPNHPGPFVDNEVDYGAEDNAVPYGEYTITITDECGRSLTKTVVNEEIPIIPVASGFDASCGDPYGYAEVSIPGKVIAEAYINVAPQEYIDMQPAMPADVIMYWDEEEMMLVITNLPPGDYNIILIDECGVEYPENPFDIGINTGGNTQMAQRPDCIENRGSITIVTQMPNSPLTEVIITVAPPEFEAEYGALPFDATAYIYTGTDGGTGNLYMDNLPPGYYEADATGSCGTLSVDKTVVAYSTSENTITPTLHCGSFDIYLKHTSTGTASDGFFLQKYDEDTDTWGHPDTGDVYPEDGSEFTEDYGLELVNNGTVSALPYDGVFRVVKCFTSYPNGMTAGRGKWCYEIIEPEIIIPAEPLIIEIVNISCDGASADVWINALGVEPLTYRLEKNNQPYIDNGTEDVFHDLEAGSYIIFVEDPCGFIVPQEFNVNDLPSLVNAYPAPDLSKCDTGNDNEEEFDLSQQTPHVLGTQNPDDVTITYHDSMGEAEDGINPLPLDYITASKTIYARATHIMNPDCIAIISFTVTVLETPKLNMNDYYPLCEGESVTITADAGYTTYLWSTGEVTQSITTSTAGTYTVDVTGTSGCPASKTAEVVLSAIPHISTIDISDWTSNENTISVMVEPSELPQDFEYSIDGFTYQDSPIFTGLPPGPYMVFVRDTYGCGMDMGEIYLLTYPKFFTPNQDGINDKWRIEFSYFEPDMEVYIYDRFGKLITSFGANSEGWDGSYNGINLPSTDYWFVVKRQDGRELKGHFAMVR